MTHRRCAGGRRALCWRRLRSRRREEDSADDGRGRQEGQPADYERATKTRRRSRRLTGTAKGLGAGRDVHLAPRALQRRHVAGRQVHRRRCAARRGRASSCWSASTAGARRRCRCRACGSPRSTGARTTASSTSPAPRTSTIQGTDRGIVMVGAPRMYSIGLDLKNAGDVLRERQASLAREFRRRDPAHPHRGRRAPHPDADEDAVHAQPPQGRHL